MTPEEAQELTKRQERVKAAREMLAKIEAVKKEALAIVPTPWGARKGYDNWNKIVDRLYAECRLVSDWESTIRWRQEQAAKKVAEAEAAAKKKEREEAANKLSGEAVVYLQDRGKVLCSDFEISNAVAMADEIAASEAIEKRKAEGGLIDFEGKNCDGPCGGWNMDDRRCECGNRRVSWTTGWGHSFKSPCVYAEAY
jgi:hypothetical protein